jgi:hypothetical protein
MSQNCGYQRAYCSHQGDMWAWRAMVMMMMMMMSAGDNSWTVHQSSLAVLLAETSRVSRRNGRRSDNFSCHYMKYLKGSLTWRKILRHGTSVFISHPNEGVLWIFIALKNPSPRTSLNSRPLGPVASTLTTTPPRRLYEALITNRARPVRDVWHAWYAVKLLSDNQEYNNEQWTLYTSDFRL